MLAQPVSPKESAIAAQSAYFFTFGLLPWDPILEFNTADRGECHGVFITLFVINKIKIKAARGGSVNT
jgi:hypothetical protein